MNDFKLSQHTNTHRVENKHSYPDAEPEIKTAPMSFGGRVLSWLGQWPIFHRIAAVKEHMDGIKVKNDQALQAFVRSLSNTYSENSIERVIECLDSVSSGKSLTLRKIEAVALVSELSSKEILADEIIAEYGPVTARKVLAMHQIISAGAQVDNIKNNINIGSIQNGVDIAAVHRTAFAVYNTTLDDIQKTFPKVKNLENLNGDYLRTNFDQLSTGNGYLRSMVTAMKGLYSVIGIEGLDTYLNLLENVHVGGIKFSQWGTVGQSAEAWVKTASDSELELAAEKINIITESFLSLEKYVCLNRMGIGTEVKIPELEIPRFSNLNVNQNTQVRLSEGVIMPVNKVTRNKDDVALAGSYPNTTPFALESHMKMLLEQKCSSLVVLAGDDQIQSEKPLPAYFRETNVYGEVIVESNPIKKERCGSQLLVDRHEMKISYRGVSHTIPVIHVQNWIDNNPLDDVESLRDLAKLVLDEHKASSKMINSNSVYENNKNINSLPMIHGLMGGGRTGTLIAAMEIIKDSSSNPEDIITELRDTRNKWMVDDAGQKEQLKWLSGSIKQSTAL